MIPLFRENKYAWIKSKEANILNRVSQSEGILEDLGECKIFEIKINFSN